MKHYLPRHFLLFFLTTLHYATFCLCAGKPERLSVEVISHDIKLRIEYWSEYEESSTVKFNFSITNNSNQDVTCRGATNPIDVRILLKDPKGSAVVPFPYGINPDKKTKSVIKPGEMLKGAWRLGVDFPFDELGEYRCQFTRLVMREVRKGGAGVEPMPNIEPLELTAPEFSFMITTLTQDDTRPRSDRFGTPDPVLDGIGTNYHYTRTPLPKPSLQNTAAKAPKEDSATKASAKLSVAPLSLTEVKHPDAGIKRFFWLFAGIVFTMLALVFLFVRKKRK